MFGLFERNGGSGIEQPEPAAPAVALLCWPCANPQTIESTNTETQIQRLFMEGSNGELKSSHPTTPLQVRFAHLRERMRKTQRAGDARLPFVLLRVCVRR